MKRHASPAHRRPSRALASARTWWALPAACLATVLALPVSAGITIPDQPLTTGNRVAPNILFILDDSGSMAWANINNQSVSAITGPGGFNSTPDANGVSSGTGVTTETTGNGAMYMQSYATNSLYYNPYTNYQPWMMPNGNRMTGGTSFTSVYSDNNYVTYSPADTTSGTKDLSAKTQTFYVPKNPASTDTTYLSNVSNYYRYQIPAGGSDVVRSEYGGVVLSGPFTVSGYPVSGQGQSKNNWLYYTISLPSNAVSITATSSGGSGNADLYIRANSNPTTSSYNCRSTGSSNNESCTVNPTSSSMYVVGLYAAKAFSNVTLNVTYTTTNSCSGSTSGNDWINCTSATPTGRSVSAELANFATWYSYHRTRIKTAKAGAAEAFGGLGNKVRVGFRTIWDRNNLDIPVKDGNDGRFIDSVSPATSSRSDWFNSLFKSYASGSTPLQKALDGAGQYFKRADSAGPYGPESGSDQLSCRQNFTILTTDGYWNTSVISSGNVDGSSGSTITGPKSQSYTYSPAAPFQDSYSNTLADVAMKYWMTDLRTENYMGNASSPNNNNVPTSDADPAFWQHMVTFTLAIGLKTTKGWGSVAEATTALQGGDSWPDPDTSNAGNDNAKRLDDLLHAAVNGHGEFTPATSPELFAQGLNKALATITQRTSSFSNVTANSTSLNTGAQIFSASYVSGVWTGALKAQAVSRTGVGALSWTASIPAVSVRKVFTANGTPGAAGTSGATFPTSAQITALDNSGVGPANYEATGAQNAAYIKGDASLEERNGVSNLRNRPTTVLGDIVNSSPAYVPGGAYGDGTAAGTVYVGANDGMLHAFDAANGQELFAYVPNILDFSKLKQLSRGDYDHKFFVDGPVVVSPRSLTPGQNILVGTLGRGGKGLYALDVSNPTSFGPSSFKWERKDTPGNNMGYVVGAPVIAQVRNGAPVPAVIFGNGPNSTNDKAVLVVMNLSDGTVIKEIPTDNTTNNGLFAPLGVYAADGKTLVYVYAGDMQGNLWKFDLRSTSPSAWTATKVFHAEKTAGKPQPITGGLASAIDIKTNQRWIFFGTGRYMTTSDADDKTPASQTLYGVIDDGGSYPYTRSNLTGRTIAVAGDYRYFEDPTPLPSASKGWYLDLPGNGERVIQDVQVDNNFVVAASMIPEGDACDASGSGFLNAIDAFTGTSGGKSYFDLDKNGSTDDTAAGGHPIGSVNLGVGMPTRPVLLPGVGVVDGSAGTGASSFGKQIMRWQRVSWREIRND